MSSNGQPPPLQAKNPVIELDEELMSPELQKYLNRNYWEQKQKDSSSGVQAAPVKTTASTQQTASSAISVTTPSAPPPSQSEPIYATVCILL